MTVFRLILPRVINMSGKSCKENKTHLIFSNVFQKIVPFTRYVEKTVRARQATGDNIIWRMRLACCIPEATDTHSEYVILITFLLQRQLHERASMLCYTYIACLQFIFSSCFRNSSEAHSEFLELSGSYLRSTIRPSVPKVTLRWTVLAHVYGTGCHGTARKFTPLIQSLTKYYYEPYSHSVTMRPILILSSYLFQVIVFQ